MTESSSAQAMPKPGLRELADLCAERNFTVRACRETGDMTLDAFLALQAEKVRRNRRIPPLCDPADLIAAASGLAGRRLGPAFAEGFARRLASGSSVRPTITAASTVPRPFRAICFMPPCCESWAIPGGRFPSWALPRLNSAVPPSRGASVLPLTRKKYSFCRCSAGSTATG